MYGSALYDKHANNVLLLLLPNFASIAPRTRSNSSGDDQKDPASSDSPTTACSPHNFLVSWIEGMASKLVGARQEKINKRMEKEKKDLISRQIKLNDLIMKNIDGDAKGLKLKAVQEDAEVESYDDDTDDNDDEGSDIDSDKVEESSDEDEEEVRATKTEATSSVGGY